MTAAAIRRHAPKQNQQHEAAVQQGCLGMSVALVLLPAKAGEGSASVPRRSNRMRRALREVAQPSTSCVAMLFVECPSLHYQQYQDITKKQFVRHLRLPAGLVIINPFPPPENADVSVPRV